MNNQQTTNPAQECCICLEAAAARGGVPLIAPGCCGKVFHMDCLNNYVKAGSSTCPACRASLPSFVAAVPPTAPPPPAPLPLQHQQQPPQPPPQQQQRSGFFGNIRNIFGSSSNISNHSVSQSAPVLRHQSHQKRNGPSTVSDLAEEELESSHVPPGESFAVTRSIPSNSKPMTERKNQTTTQQTVAESRPTGTEHDAAAGEMEGVENSDNTDKGSDSCATESSSAHPTVVLETSPELPEVGLGGDEAFHVRLSVKYQAPPAQDGEGELSKVPMDIICVLDNSGSMDGDKITNLKRALEFVIATLGPNDRLSVIKFNSRACGVHGLIKMTPANKDKSLERVRQIEANGGTAIYDGMEMAQTVIGARRTTNPATCVFLLTDGQDRSNFDRKKEMARQWCQQGVSLFVFGFGADHDSAHMNGIADAGEGSFTYIDTDDTVIDAFGGALGSQQGQALRNISVSLSSGSLGCTFSHVSAGNYRVISGADGLSADVCFASLYPGETRDILVRAVVPALSGDQATANYPVLTANGTYCLQTVEATAAAIERATSAAGSSAGADAGGGAGAGAGSAASGGCLPCRPVTCAVSRPLDKDRTPPHLLVRNTDVDVQVNRFMCLQATNSAMNLADREDFTAAVAVLEDAKSKIMVSVSYTSGDPVVLALVEELKDYLVRVRDRSEYQSRGGRAMMSEGYSNFSKQRCAYTKAGKSPLYQNDSSVQVQRIALASKSAAPSKGFK